MLAKGQLDDAISCSLRAIVLNRNNPKAERDVEGRCALRASVLVRAACPAGPAAAQPGEPQSRSAHPPRQFSRQNWLARRASSDRSEPPSGKSE
jgi:hypothetical protein